MEHSPDYGALAPHELSAARLVSPLLRRMMVQARRLRDTPLQFEIDSSGIVLAAWSEFCLNVPPEARAPLRTGEQLCGALDLLIRQTLDAAGAAVGAGADRPRTTADDSNGQRAVAPGPALAMLAQWFDRLCLALQDVDAQAINVLALLLDGYDARDIARRVGRGARLIQRLLGEIRGAILSDDCPVTPC